MYLKNKANIHTWVTWQSKYNYQYSLQIKAERPIFLYVLLLPEGRSSQMQYLYPFSRIVCILNAETYYILQSSRKNVVL